MTNFLKRYLLIGTVAFFLGVGVSYVQITSRPGFETKNETLSNTQAKEGNNFLVVGKKIVQDLAPFSQQILEPEGSSTQFSKKTKKIIIYYPAFLPAVLPPTNNIATSSKEIGGIIAAATNTQGLIIRVPDENTILPAVVKIECPIADGFGKYVGSGFVLKDGVVITAAHVVMDSGSEICRVIFPQGRKPTYYLQGTITDFKNVKANYDQKGIDAAYLQLPLIDSYPEARAIFQNYPFIPYQVCKEPEVLGDIVWHFGYPSNYVDQNFLSKLDGKAVLYADIHGTKETLSEDQTYAYRIPNFTYTSDQTRLHPYLVSRVGTFYGDSGGLAFDATKQCILGPQSGGSIYHNSSGENYSVLMMLGWRP